MNKTTAKKATELLEEINSLYEYKDLLEDKSNGKVAHIEFVQHYGIINSAYDKVVFNEKYNKYFLPVIEGIIIGLEAELASL